MKFHVDSVALIVEAVAEEVKVVNDSGLAKIINKLSFGVFCNEALEVKVKATDNTEIGDMVFDATEHQQGFATFRLPIGTKGEITMWATDGAGNSSKDNLVKLSVKKDDVDVTNWVLENIAPEITATTPEDLSGYVDLSTASIQLSFSEDVTPVPAGPYRYLPDESLMYILCRKRMKNRFPVLMRQHFRWKTL